MTLSLSEAVVFDLIFATVLLLIVAAAGLVPVQLPSVGAAAAHWPVVLAAGIGLAAAGYVMGRVAHRRLRVLWDRVRQGGAILRTPGRYLRRVALVQAGAWCCRIAVVLCLLAGFGLPASIPVAGVVMVVAGASTLIPLAPVPGRVACGKPAATSVPDPDAPSVPQVETRPMYSSSTTYRLGSRRIEVLPGESHSDAWAYITRGGPEPASYPCSSRAGAGRGRVRSHVGMRWWQKRRAPLIPPEPAGEEPKILVGARNAS